MATLVLDCTDTIGLGLYDFIAIYMLMYTMTAVAYTNVTLYYTAMDIRYDKDGPPKYFVLVRLINSGVSIS